MILLFFKYIFGIEIRDDDLNCLEKWMISRDSIFIVELNLFLLGRYLLHEKLTLLLVHNLIIIIKEILQESIYKLVFLIKCVLNYNKGIEF